MAYASTSVPTSRHLAHRRERSSPSAARARTARDPSVRTTLASGCAWRLSHQAGSPSAQPFVITEDGAALPARASPDRREAHGAPLVGFRRPQSAPAPGKAIRGTVNCPSGADEPTWRKFRASIGTSGHATLLLRKSGRSTVPNRPAQRNRQESCDRHDRENRDGGLGGTRRQHELEKRHWITHLRL